MKKTQYNLSSKSFITRANMFFGDLINATSDCIWLVDKKTNLIVYANYACELHYGYSQEDFIGMPISHVNILGDLAVRREMKKIEKNPLKSNSFVAVHRLRSDKVIDVQVESKLTEFNGREYYVSRITDITEQIRLHQDLQLHRLILDNNENCSSTDVAYRALLDKFRGCTIGLISVAISPFGSLYGKCSDLFYQFAENKLQQLIYPMVQSSGYILHIEAGKFLIAVPNAGDEEIKKIRDSLERVTEGIYFECNKQLCPCPVVIKMATGMLDHKYKISNLIKEVI